jgi:hypothetical protein
MIDGASINDVLDEDGREVEQGQPGEWQYYVTSCQRMHLVSDGKTQEL